MKIIIAIVLLATIVLALFIYGKLQNPTVKFSFNNNTNIGYYIESSQREEIKTGSLSKRITTYWLSYTDEKKSETLFFSEKRDEVEAKMQDYKRARQAGFTHEQSKLLISGYGLKNSHHFFNYEK